MNDNPTPKDLRPEGSTVLKATYIAELARAQQYAVAAVVAGYYHAADLCQVRTKYIPFPVYTITTQEKPDGPRAA